MTDKPPLDDDLLVHYGVKGMRWGIRNADAPGVQRFQAASGLTVDPKLHQSTKAAGKQVAELVEKRYGFHISEIKSYGPGSAEYANGTAGFVQLTPGQKGGVIFASQDDLRKVLKHSEDVGWTKEGTGNPTGFLTHETAHAIFHAEQQEKLGFFGVKTVGGEIKARDAALKASVKEAKRTGIAPVQFMNSVSGYAASSGMRQETEAELFSQYHWSPNPPSFVKVWGETLHQELGVDPTPFREEVKRG